MNKNVAIIGATKKIDRYAYKTLKKLIEKGYSPFPVNPVLDEIDGIKCYHDIASIPEHVDTITVYVRPSILKNMIPDIIKAKPKRVIFNPGTENEEIMRKIGADKDIQIVQACTLVMLNTGQFDAS